MHKKVQKECHLMIPFFQFALNFDGNDFVDFNSKPLNWEAFTVIAWIKTNSNGAVRIIEGNIPYKLVLSVRVNHNKVSSISLFGK